MDDDQNLYGHFRAAFPDDDTAVALTTSGSDPWRYADLESLSARYAAVLAGSGVRPGDRVSVQAEKSPGLLCLYLACLRGGFVYHPLNTGYTAAELDYFLTDAEPAAVVSDPSGRDTLASLSGCPARLYTLAADGTGTLADAAADAAPSPDIVPRADDELAALLYSSGTTGRPKGVMLSHANLLANTQTLVAAWGFTPDDRLLHALPIFHVHGLFVAIGCALLSGASMRWLPRYDAAEVVRHLPECTVMMGVPTYYTRLLARDDFTADTCRNMRLFVSGSAPLLPETFEAFEARTGHRILERYGMTETNMNTSNPLDGERKPGTVGPPLPGVSVRVVDDEGGERPAGEIGHLQVRGPNVFRGYWRMPEKTAEDFTEDGWFHTGDLASIDADGYVAIVGRSKDMIITGGLNVYPKEIEVALDAQPGVRESAVIGVPHPDYGEAVVAVVVPDGEPPSADALVATLRDELAGYKLPKRIVFVDELPRNTMAKVQKNVLRERCAGLFD